MSNTIYVPILKAKKGEYDAVIHLSERATAQLKIWFDITQIDKKSRNNSKEIGEPVIETFLNKTASDIANAWPVPPIFFENRTIFLDLPKWASNAQAENGEHVVPYMRNRLEVLGINVNPVIRYDFWDDPVYINAFKDIRLKNEQNFCIRLSVDVDTIDDIKADPDYVRDRLLDIANKLTINPAETYLLIDFGDISNQKYFIEELVDITKQIVPLIQNIGFSKIMLAGSSLPSSVNLAVKAQNTTGLVLRKEMLIWQTLLHENPSLNIIFADYGIRNPSSSDESKPCPNANGKIRYTTKNQYFVARGQELYKGLIKFHQYPGLAQVIVNSEYYLGNTFSWGDKCIFNSANLGSKGSGNQQNWISYDTNHHIESVVMEVLEFHRSHAF